eukprot:CAMPEP_0119032258 /NCGR_PEP_ID=MMETSP1176-20130426/41961_1 /TAXON_ID=265551 /ORGANISM="Synedropsis recta cf, Strain CCMP1620" /LENGTH=126 /DNA_ID=CAMNT_0006988669 /DNA_START=1 /DNA_END=381 /DNA_ORIENTATION=+
MECFSRVLENDNKVLERLTFWPKVPCLIKKVEYWTLLNRCKRGSRILSRTEKGDVVPIALWAHILASRPNDASVVYYFISQMPTLFDVVVCNKNTKPSVTTKRSSLAASQDGEEKNTVEKRMKQET